MLFDLGQIVITTNCLEFCDEHHINPVQYLHRHARCDWGNLDEHDRHENELALMYGNRLFSSYDLPDNLGKIWVITEWNRSVTTILLPEDY